MWGKIESQKLLNSPLQEIWLIKSKTKMLEMEPKKNLEEKWIEKKPEEKTGWNENEEKQKRKTKVELVPHAMKNDPWSNYPKTQFGPIYPFFRNPEPRPTLRFIKVHFDWTWILRLERFFLREFSSKIILINHPPIWDELWIFECIMGQSKKKNEKMWL